MMTFLHNIDADPPTIADSDATPVPDGFQVIELPPELFGTDVRTFVRCVVSDVERMRPAVTPLHRAVYRILARLADAKVTASPQAVVLGLILGAARVSRIRIATDARDLAQEACIRYATLLKVRKIAAEELARLA